MVLGLKRVQVLNHGWVAFWCDLIYFCTIIFTKFGPQASYRPVSCVFFSRQKAIKEKEIPIEGLEFMGHGKEKPESSS